MTHHWAQTTDISSGREKQVGCPGLAEWKDGMGAANERQESSNEGISFACWKPHQRLVAIVAPFHIQQSLGSRFTNTFIKMTHKIVEV